MDCLLEEPINTEGDDLGRRHRKRLKQYTKEQLLAAYNQYGSMDAAAVSLGCNRKTFSKYWYTLVREKPICNFNPQDPPPKSASLKKFSKNEINEAIDTIEAEGYFVTKKPLMTGYSFKLDLDYHHGQTFAVGLVSDTHIVSRHQQLTNLWKFYKYCEHHNIRNVLHAGDLTEGMGVYQGQAYESFLHGADLMTKYIVENYPEFDDITTTFICGNHDESIYQKMGGHDIGLAVSKERRDMVYRGFHSANFEVDDISICLHHGSGGVAYARSYKAQQLAVAQIEEYFHPIPKIVILGHYHVSCILPSYLGMYMVQMPCFQSQTNYLKKKGLMPNIGGVILEFENLEDSVFETPRIRYIKYDRIVDDF